MLTKREERGGDARSVSSEGSGSKGSGSKGGRRGRGGSGSGSGGGPEDLAKGKDVIFTTKVMKYLLKQHPEWHELGLAYDCGSSLYTSERLVFPGQEDHRNMTGDFTDGPQYQEDITWPQSNEVNLKVVITPVSLIVPPVEGNFSAIFNSNAQTIKFEVAFTTAGDVDFLNVLN